MVVALATKPAGKPAATKAATKPAAAKTPRKRAPRKRKPKEPTVVETVGLELGDAVAVLSLDDSQYRLNADLVGQLHKHFERAYFGLL